MRRIEEQLGVRLFDRDRGGVRLTPAGEQFVEGAERILIVAEETARSARNAHAGHGQNLRIGMTQIAAYQVMIPSLSEFRHPPLHAPGLSETFLLSTPMVVFDGAPEPEKTKPLIACPRTEAPVLMGALARLTIEGSGEYPTAEANTMLGAIVLSRAGFGPFAATEDYPSPFEKMETYLGKTKTGLMLDTAIAKRSLDRRPILQSLFQAATIAAGRL